MGADISTVEDFLLTDTLPDKPWRIENGTVLSTNTPISVFSTVKNDKKYWVLLRALTKQIRCFRHPAIIQYVDSEERPEGPFLMTEQVKPLALVLDSMSATEVCAGLHNVLEAVEFLHDHAAVSHNNIHLGAVYVAADGSWRLGGLEFACRFTMATDTHLASNRALRNQEALAPEEKAGQLLVEPAVYHARDVYSLAILIESLLERLGDLGDLTKTFELRIQDECLSMESRQRPRVKSLLADRLFTMEFLDIESFLKTIVLKSDEERNAFYKSLVPKLLCLPEQLVARRLVPSLLTRFVVMDPVAVQYVLPSLLTPCSGTRPTQVVEGEVTSLLTQPIYECYVVPLLLKMFSVRDYHLHVLLLQHLHSFLPMISEEDLEFEILPELLVGLRDSSEVIAAHSMHALADLIPILGRAVVVGGDGRPYYPERTPKENRSTKSPGGPGKKTKQRLIDFVTASSRSPAVQNKGDLEEKQKERERKRKDAEIRREQRKKKLEEKRLAQQKAKDLIMNHSTIPEETEPELDMFSSETVSEKPQYIDREIEFSEINSADQVIEETSMEPKGSFLDTENDNSIEDWADVGDKSDTDFSDEIEEELQNLRMNELNTEKKSLYHSQIGQPLELKKHSSKAMTLTSKTTQNSLDTGVYTDASDIPLAPVPQTVPIASSRSSRLTANNSHKKNKELGSEFDFKSIPIKVKEQSVDPFDLLNDMAPTIEKAPVFDADAANTITTNNGSVHERRGSKEEKIMGVSFKFTDNSEQTVDDGDGWSDDGW